MPPIHQWKLGKRQRDRGGRDGKENMKKFADRARSF